MAWLRFSDNWNRRPEIRALDDGTYRALQCLIEAAEAFDACGIVTDDYAMTVYPHARQKLRNLIRKLEDRGLVHAIQSIDDHCPDCPTCKERQTEVGAEVVQKSIQKWGTSVTTSARSRRTEVVLICIRVFFDVAMTPEQKAEKRQKDADRQRRKRERDKAGLSRRDAEPLSRPPVPVPDPELRINDHPIALKEREPTSTASPSTPSNVAADLGAVSKLRGEYEARWQQAYPGKRPPRWKDDQLSHFDEIERRASEEPEPTAILAAALAAFFADESQQTYRHVPQGLLMNWNRYVAPVREQIESEARERRIADREADYQRAKAVAEAKAEADRLQRRRQRQSNGGATPNNLGIDPASLADLIGTQPGGEG